MSYVESISVMGIRIKLMMSIVDTRQYMPTGRHRHVIDNDSAPLILRVQEIYKHDASYLNVMSYDTVKVQ